MQQHVRSAVVGSRAAARLAFNFCWRMVGRSLSFCWSRARALRCQHPCCRLPDLSRGGSSVPGLRVYPLFCCWRCRDGICHGRGRCAPAWCGGQRGSQRSQRRHHHGAALRRRRPLACVSLLHQRAPCCLQAAHPNAHCRALSTVSSIWLFSLQTRIFIVDGNQNMKIYCWLEVTEVTCSNKALFLVLLQLGWRCAITAPLICSRSHGAESSEKKAAVADK